MVHEFSPWNPPKCGKIKTFEVPTCPHCLEQVKMFMPIPELQYCGPVGVCRNEKCSYYLRSEKWSEHQMGFSGYRYRYCYSFAEKIDMPIHSTICDDPSAFVYMGKAEIACKEWNTCIDAYNELKKDNEPKYFAV